MKNAFFLIYTISPCPIFQLNFLILFILVNVFCYFLFYHIIWLHAVSCTQQGRQRGPRVNTLRSLLSPKFLRRDVLSSGTQRRALPRPQNEEMKM